MNDTERANRARAVGTALIESAQRLGSPTTMPDGRGFAVVRRTSSFEQDRSATAIEVWMDAAGEPIVIPGEGKDTAPQWSPNGRTLSLHREAGGFNQVFVLDDPAGQVDAPQQLTSFPGGVMQHAWSPDGSKVAVVVPLPASPLSPSPDALATWMSQPVQIDRQPHKLEGLGLLRDLVASLFVVDAATNDARPLVVGVHHVQTMAWSPDGRHIAFSAMVERPPSPDPRALLHVVALETGEVQEVACGLPSVGAMAWGAAGLVVVAQSRVAADEFGHLHLLDPLGDRAPKRLAPDLDANVGGAPFGHGGSGPRILDDGTCVFTLTRNGVHEVVALAPASDEVVTVAGGGRATAVEFDARGSWLTVVASDDESFDFALHGQMGRLGVVVQGGRRPDAVPPASLRSLQDVLDSSPVPGWIVLPDGDGPHPLLLDVHGGPHAMWGPTLTDVTWYRHVLVERGWAVLALNTTGSDGHGQTYASGLRAAWGEADGRQWHDVIDRLVERGVVDASRIAVTGYSYGGFMTNWLAATSDRFVAAVAGGSIADLVSYSGTADVGPMFLASEMGAELLDDPEVYRAHSPLTYAAKLTTPLLLLQGAADTRTPVGQAEQMYSALRRLGRTVELVIYPDIGHGLRAVGRPSHRLDYGMRLIDWIERHAAWAQRPRV